MPFRQWPEVSDFVARFCTLRESKASSHARIACDSRMAVGILPNALIVLFEYCKRYLIYIYIYIYICKIKQDKGPALCLMCYHKHTHTNTNRRTHTDTQTHRHTDTQTHAHTHTHTHTHMSNYYVWSCSFFFSERSNPYFWPGVYIIKHFTTIFCFSSYLGR